LVKKDMPTNFASHIQNMGSLGHHIRSGSGKILGKIGSSGSIRDSSGRRIGSISKHGHVRDLSGKTIGAIGSNGRLLDARSGHHFQMGSGGRVLDHTGQKLGTLARGDAGGAALLMLLGDKAPGKVASQKAAAPKVAMSKPAEKLSRPSIIDNHIGIKGKITPGFKYTRPDPNKKLGI
jgi:hypothetical protein